MTRWSRVWIPVVGAMLVLAVALPLLLRHPRTEPATPFAEAWEAGFTFPVRVIDGARIYDVELTDYPAVNGRVAYEGPTMSEGVENWNEAHAYRGVDLRAVVEGTVGLEHVETLTLVALDGWHKTLPGGVLTGETACGKVVLALSMDAESPAEWAAAPLLVFLPQDERFSNEDMLDALGADLAHYFGAAPSSTGLMVKGVVFLVMDYDGGPLPTLADL